MDVQTPDSLIAYFDVGVLSYYESQPDKYLVETDFFEGQITLTQKYAAELRARGNTQEVLRVRFGYRTLKNGSLAIAAYKSDLTGYSGREDRSSAHLRRWNGFLLESPEWAEGPDERFDLWLRRRFEGDWDVDDGPLRQLEQTVHVLNAVTCEVLGCPLFKWPENAALRFPSSQNTYGYQDSHLELYRLLLDGLNKRCIDQIAEQRGVVSKSSDKKTREALQAALSSMPSLANLWSALDLVSRERRKAAHGDRPAAEPFPAFERFNQDLNAVLVGLRELLAALETILNMTGEIASERQTAKKGLPKIDAERAVEAHFAISQIRQAEGKTIDRVEYGFEKQLDGVHETEAIILHFTDGSVLGITTGSNVEELMAECDELSPKDLSVDFILRWVPPLDNP